MLVPVLPMMTASSTSWSFRRSGKRISTGSSAVSVLVIFPLKPYEATIVVAAAAMPVAGNVFMLAQHYGVAAKRVSAAILFSTAISILTFPLVVSWVSPS